MALRKLLGSVIRSFSNGQLTRRQGGEVRRSRLFLETLEAREVLATAPFVTAVSPINGASNVNTNSPFNITVTYSESMATSALTASNYILLDSAGNTLAFQGNGTFSSVVTTNDTVTLTVSSSLTPLPVDSYTLFVRGEKVFDTNDNLPLAIAPQLVSANGGRNNVSVMTVNSDATIGTVGTYIEPPNGTQAANPFTVDFGDFDGDNINDLVVVNSGTNTVAIYQGKDPGEGGGYAIDADLTLSLPAVTPTNKIKAIALGDLNKDGLLDLVVANEDTGTMSIFLNSRATVGTLSFATSVDTTTTLLTPKDVAIADVDGDGSVDILVLNGALDGSSNYTVSIFKGDGTGAFTAPTAGTQVGTATIGAQSPVAFAVGRFTGNDNKIDIAVAGTNGVAVVNNTSTSGTISFAAPTVVYTGTGLLNLRTASPDATVFGTVESADIPASPANRFRVTSTGHGLQNGDTVRLAGINGFTGASVSGEFTVVASNANTFQVSITGLTGTYTSGGTWERVDRTADDLIAGLAASGVYLLNNGQATWVASTAAVTAGAGGRVASGDLDNNHTTEFAFTNANATTPQVTVVDRNTAFRAVETATVPVNDTLRVTSTAHGLAVNAKVTLTGITGITGFAAGEYTVTAVGPSGNTFDVTITGVTNATAYTSGGTWARSSASATYNVVSGVVTVTSAGHKLTTGAPVTISGSTGGNGTYVIRVLDADTFQLVAAPSGGAITYTGAAYVVAGAIGADPSGPYAAGATATGIAIGDTNGDGNTDVVTADRTANTFSVLLGAGNRTLQTSTTTAITPTTLRAVTYADLNQDSIKDIAVVNSTGTSSQSRVTIMLGKADGTFNAPSDFTIGTSGGSVNTIGAIAAVDLNADGKLDIVVGGKGSVAGTSYNGVLAVLRNTTSTAGGAVTFAGANFFQTGEAPTSIVGGLLDNDTKIDLAVSHNNTNKFGSRGLALMKNTSSGTTISFSNFTDGKSTFNEAADSVGKTIVNGVRAGGVVALDFNKDGKTDLAVAQNDTAGNVYVLQGDGLGRFSLNGTVSSNAQSLIDIESGDFNNDGFVDLVVASSSQGNGTGGISVLLNQAGGSFAAGARSDVNPGTPLASIVVLDANQDGKLDVIAGTALATGGKGFTLSQSNTADNIYVLTGRNDGSFFEPVPYFAGGVGTTGGKTPQPVYPPPTYLAVGDSALIKLTTFSTGGNVVVSNLVRNGGFEQADLTGEQGNLLGWTTYKLPDVPVGSHGGWSIQTGSVSPVSGVTVNSPSGKYQAMLDQANIQPFQSGTNNPNNPSDYAGSHAIYQDIFIPSDAITATLSLRLYLNSEGNFSDTSGGTQILDYRTSAPNQQVRVDILSTTGDLLAVTNASNLLQNLFLTAPTTAKVGNASGLTNINMAAYKGQTVRLRIAATNNQGRLTVGVDDVLLNVKIADGTKPTVSGLKLRNPGFLINGVPTTTDPSFGGTVTDNVGLANIYSVTFDVNNDGFGGADDITIINNPSSPTNLFDSSGNFIFPESKLASVPKGQRTISVRAADRAGNLSDVATITFNNQQVSSNEFMAVGPNGIEVDKAYGKVTGRITAIDYDLSDKTGATYYVGTDNGGVWKTTNGGVSWTPLMDFLTDSSGARIFPPIGSIAVSKASPVPFNSISVVSNAVHVSSGVVNHGLVTGQVVTVSGLSGGNSAGNGNYTVTVIDANNFRLTGAPTNVSYTGASLTTKVIYAGTGIADLSIESRLGTGVLKSVDLGATWTRIGNSGTVLANSRISKIIIDGENPLIVYAGVAAGGQDGPGVYKSTDGGLTWLQTMNATSMAMATGTFDAVASVTDMVIDPFNPNRLLVGLGNIGLGAARATAGLWRSANKGGSWDQIRGGDNTAITNNTLPLGTTVGTVKVAIGSGRIGDERFVYAFIGKVPGNNTPPSVDLGGYDAVYKTSDNLLNWTKISLKQETSAANPASHSFQNINFGKETTYASSLVVDPVNANVIYIAGSRRYDETNPLTHSLIRVDTGNMRDGRSNGAGGFISNDGDDITKADDAAVSGGPARNFAGYYDRLAPPNGTQTTADPYNGEGVAWYDVEQHQINGVPINNSGSTERFPPTVTSLKFDSLGRLLIGTNGGIWRAANLGVPYDFTSGGKGIVPGNPSSTPGFKVSALNGNLQIADLTSVAIDPTMTGMYYVTTLGLGGASSLDPSTGAAPNLLTWNSQSQTGPTIGLDTNNNPISAGIPNAGVVRVTSPAPGAPAGTPATLLRLWQYTQQQALYPERSGDNGETWDASNSAGIPTQNNSAGYFASLAVNPNKIAITDPQTQQLTYVDEIILGTNRVFLTRSSGNVYDPISPILATGGATLTAVALAPSSTTGFYYAGTSDGQVFVAANGGGLNATDWPNRSLGLPTGGVAITGAALANGTITAASYTGTSLTVTSTAHGLSTGTSVTLAALGGLTNAAGTWTITAATADTFTVTTTTAVTGTYTSGGTWTRADRLTVTSAGHGLTVGAQVKLASIGGITGAAGTFTITAVTPDTFEVSGTGFGGAYTSGGTWALNLPVQSITVDPNQPNTAYVALGGLNDTTTPRVYKTTDGGLNWSNISSNLPRTPVYSIVLDRRPGLNAPGGKIYAATNLGVFASIDEGVNWIRVGSSMPTAPVVDLQQDQTTGLMAAATQGRGLFVLSTNPITPVDDIVVNEDDTSAPISFSLNGLGVRTDNLSATVTSGDQVLLPNSGISLVRNGLDYTLRLTPAANRNGTVTVTITATDGTRNFTETFNLLVNSVDDAPVISAVTPQVLAKSDPAGLYAPITGASITGSTLTLTSANSLAAGDTVTLYGVGGITKPQNVPFNSSSVVNNAVQVNAANHGLFTGQSITVSGLNAPNAAGNGTYTATVIDANNFQLTGAPTNVSYALATLTARVSVMGEYTVVGAPTGTSFAVSITGVAGTYTSGGVWAKTSTISGAIAILGGITVNTTAPHGLTVGDLVTLTGTGGNGVYSVTAVNSASSFNVANAPIGVPYAGGKVVAGVVRQFTVSDPDNLTGDPAAGLGAVTATSDNTALIPNASIAIDGSGTNRVLAFTPAANVGGTANITISVGDGINTTTRKVAVQVRDTVTTPTHTDDFNRPDNVFLGGVWTDQVGDLQVVGQKAVSMFNGSSLSTLNGVTERDVGVQADVNIIAGSNQALGLITRYTGPGQQNFYMAEAYAEPGSSSVRLSIYRNLGGSFALLSTTTLSGGITGTLRFESVDASHKVFLNGSLVLTAIDGILNGAVTVGVRATGASGAVSFDNFTYDKITITPATLPHTDDFATASNGQLSTKYIEQSGNFNVNTTTGKLSNATDTAITSLRGVAQKDQAVSVDVNLTAGSGQAVGLMARYAGSGDKNYYLAQLYAVGGIGNNVKVDIFINVGGSFQQLATGTIAGATLTGTFRFEAVGSSLKAYFGDGTSTGDTLVAFANDTMFDGSVSAGMRIFGAGASNRVTLDNFKVEAVPTPANATLPHSDDFSTATRQQLSDKYIEQSGNFKVNTSTGKLSNNTGLAITSLRGVTQKDQAVSVDVSLTAGSGQAVGLMARYAGSGDKNYYLAQLYAVGGIGNNVKVDIFINVGGSFQQLATGTIAGATLTGTFRFEAVGSSLKAYFGDGTAANDVLVAFANDTMFDGSVSAGMRIAGPINGVVLDNFKVEAVAAPANATLPHSDNFGTANRQQLSDKYIEQSGNFKLNHTANTASNNTALAIATLRGVNSADVTVKLDVSLTAGSGNAVGLLARYAGSGEGTGGYLAEMYAEGGLGSSVRISIFRRSGGGYTRIATGTTSDTSGTLEFVLNGTSLTAKIDGVTVASTSDSAFTTGSVGMRLNGGTNAVVVQNFSATSP